MATDSSLWVNNGGVISSPKLSNFLRYSAQPLLRFRAFADVKDAIGKNQGESFNWDKIANVSTIGGLLTETSTMPVSSQTITKGTLTVNEFGNSIPHTFKLEVLSQPDAERIIERGLRDDMVKVLDARVHAQFNKTPLVYVGTTTATYALTTDTSVTAVNTSAVNNYHLGHMKLELEKRNVPTLDGDTYAFILALEGVESLQEEMISVNQYTEQGYKKIVSGEVGIINGIRIIKDNNATRLTYDLSARTTTAKTWAQAKSLEGFMFGADSVTEAVVVPEEIRAKEVTDYGRSKGMAWYFLGDWEIEWSDAANAKIVKWASAS